MTTAPHPECQPGRATPGPWKISDVRSTEGEYLIVGGVGQDFGLIAAVPEKADAELIVALRARVDELTRALEWRPIETAPRDGTDFLALCEHQRKRHQMVGCFAPNGKFASWPGRNNYHPTHWMPLPGSPAVPLEQSGSGK